MEQVEVFENHRPLLFSIAYRMLGTVMEAEDILQEAFLRWRDAAAETIDSPKSYLATVVTRLCIDYLRSAQVRREEYIGPWLPEPLVADPAAGPVERQAMSDSLSIAFLVILESLAPTERAVFLLREVFGYEYNEIAQIVGKSEANCRQMASRARREVAQRRPRFDSSPQQQTSVVNQFLDTISSGDVESLLSMLDKDVTWWSDGGGQFGVAQKPIRGAENVAHFIMNLVRRSPDDVATLPVEVNGGPGLIIYVAGQRYGVLSFGLANGRIGSIWAVVNPDKLSSVPPYHD